VFEITHTPHSDSGFPVSKRFKDDSEILFPLMGYLGSVSSEGCLLGSIYHHSTYLLQAHGTDIFNSYNEGVLGGELCDYIICFVNNLNPNGCQGKGTTQWPEYDLGSKSILQFNAILGMQTTTDTYREDAINFLIGLMQKYPLY
jgi:hypothetical protein